MHRRFLIKTLANSVAHALTCTLADNVAHALACRASIRAGTWPAAARMPLLHAKACATLLVTVLSVAALCLAQEAATPVPPVRPFRLPARVGVFVEAQLPLQQAVALALANNNDIDGSRIDRDISGFNTSAARGVFDPLFSIASQFQKQTNPVASSLGGSATGAVLNRLWLADPGVSGSLPWFGGTYRADWTSQRTTTNNTFTTLNPQYPAALNLQYTQPLWRGFRYDQNRRTLDISKKNQSISQEQFRQRVMQVVQQTEQAYWELVYAYNNLQVQLEAVDIARQQDESNRRQEQQGLLAPIDVVAAQTQLANFELNAYSGQTALTRAENNLKTLMLADRTAAMWSAALVPATRPDSKPPVIPLMDAVTEGIGKRPELAQLQFSGEINQSDTKFLREQTKPQVDLIASYTGTGLAGAQLAQSGSNPLTASLVPLADRINALSQLVGLQPISLAGAGGGGAPALLVGGYGQSLNNLFAGNFPTTLVQLRVSLPVHNRAAEANLSRALAEGKRIRNQKDQTEQLVEADVRNSMQTMQSAEARLDAAQVARQSAEEQYNSEQRQFRAGTSTLFLVQQRQSTMIAARSQERRAESDLAQAIASFELAKGSILERHNVNLQ